MRSGSTEPRPGKRQRLASALDAVGLLDRALWVKSKLGLPVLTVLTYHRIAEDEAIGELDADVIDVRPGAFAQQLEVLRQHCRPVTSAELVGFRKGKPLPPNPVLIAFDDGYMDCHDVALPLLQRAGMPATFFIPTAYPDAGKLFWWDRVSILIRRCTRDVVELEYPSRETLHPLADPQAATRAVSHLVKNNPGVDPDRLIAHLERAAEVSLSADEEKAIAARTIMGMAEVRALLHAGMDVQSHSHSHRVLDTMTPDEACQDLRRSRAVLSEALGRSVDAVAYPVGYTLRGKYRRIAGDSGFSIGFTNSSGLCRLDQFDPYSISRIAMGTEHAGSAAKLVLLLGAQPHRLHDPKLRLFTGESRRPLSRRLIADLPSVLALAPQWQALEQRAASRSPTSTADWMLSWWRMFGDTGGRQLAVLEVRDGERLVGLAPLQTRRHWYPPGVPYRRVELLASGEDEADEVLSEYIGVLAEPDYEARVADELATVLANDVAGWDELVMPLMDGSGRMPHLLADALRDQGIVVHLDQQSEAPYIELPASWDEYLAALTSERRYFVNRSLRDFDRWANADASVERATCPESLQRGLSVLEALHADRWNAERPGGAFASPRFRGFHRAVMPRLLEQGALDLSWMVVRGEPVAALYSIVWDGKVHFYQSGRKPDVPSKVRPGIVLHAQAIQRAIAAGLREYDFLGGASQYKTRMATATRPLVQLRATRAAVLDTVRGLARSGITNVRAWLARGGDGTPRHNAPAGP